MEIQKGAKIGFFSRIDYGSKGFRLAVLSAGYDEFRKKSSLPCSCRRPHFGKSHFERDEDAHQELH